MLVQLRYSVVADLHLREEGHGPRVSCAEDDVIHIRDAPPVNEMNCSAFDPLDGLMLLYARVVEGIISKIAIGIAADGDGVNWRLGCFCVSQVKGNIGC